MSALDAAIQAATPALMVPHDGELPELLVGRKRFLLAADGIYLDVASAAMRARLRVATMPMPYGPVTPFISLVDGTMPAKLLQDAITTAIAHPSVEVAFGIEASDAGYVLRQPAVRSASAAHITYDDVLDDERLVLDLHSHGRAAAFFSTTDDDSDLARVGPYIAAVVGRVHQTPELALRFVCPPYLIPLSIDDLRPLLAESNATSDGVGG